jgi:hypothetical protein
MTCPECIKNDAAEKAQKLTNLLPKFRNEAANKGLTEFAVIETVNKNPQYGWRPIGHEDTNRLKVEGYYIVY